MNCWNGISQSAAKLIFNDYNGSTTIEKLLLIIIELSRVHHYDGSATGLLIVRDRDIA